MLKYRNGRERRPPPFPTGLRRLYRCAVCRSKTALAPELPCEPCWDAYLDGDPRLLLLRLAMRPTKVGRMAHGMITADLWHRLHQQRPG